MVTTGNINNVKTAVKTIPTTRPLSQEQITHYNEEGFIIVPNFFDPEEVEPILKALAVDPEWETKWTKWGDRHGNLNQIAAWTELDDSLLGIIPRTSRMVSASEVLLGGVECYHWHSKLIVKNPHSPAWIEWHQGYGAWYNDGCLYPHFVTCTLAVDNNTRENGCLQVLRKSHLMGRVNHELVGDAISIDPVRMEKIMEKLELVYCEMQPGDALFLHANTIHCSGDNRTDRPRTAITCHYNAASNEPFCVEQVPFRRYSPLNRVPDTTIVDGNYSSILNSQVVEEQKKALDRIIKYGLESENK